LRFYSICLSYSVDGLHFLNREVASDATKRLPLMTQKVNKDRWLHQSCQTGPPPAVLDVEVESQRTKEPDGRNNLQDLASGDQSLFTAKELQKGFSIRQKICFLIVINDSNLFVCINQNK